MSDNDRDGLLTGGCQCGAVRYACDVAPENVHVCHCRMCQKAVGGPFAVICPFPKMAFRVTRGQIAWFASSALARRGFCRDCGTPLIFDYPEDLGIGVLAGSLDQPDRVPPVIQYGIETELPWIRHLPEVPGQRLYEDDPKGYLPPSQPPTASTPITTRQSGHRRQGRPGGGKLRSPSRATQGASRLRHRFRMEHSEWVRENLDRRTDPEAGAKPRWF